MTVTPRYPLQQPNVSTGHRNADTKAGLPAVDRSLNQLAAELKAMAAELGLNPSATATDVAARIAALEATVAGLSASADPRVPALASAPRLVVPPRAGAWASGAPAGTYMLTAPSSSIAVAGAVAATSASSAGAPFLIDPAAWPAITGLTKKLRLRASVLTNAVAPGINFTFKLLPVASWGGASNAAPTVASFGADISGGAAAVNAPAAAGMSAIADSGLFDFPGTAGWYVLGCTLSGTNAANSIPVGHARLEAAYA